MAKIKIIIPSRRKDGSLIPKEIRDKIIDKVKKKCMEVNNNVKVTEISSSLN